MADSSGLAYKDLVPLPDTEAITNPSKEEAALTLEDGPTVSHALATSPSNEEPGLVQMDHDEEVKDLGWNQAKEDIPAPLVGGMENEDLWVLVRRFDKVCLDKLAFDSRHVKLPLLTFISSKCTTSKNTRILWPMTSISTSPTRTSSRLTSCVRASSGST